MSEPFIAEIRIFAGNFAPRSWAFCDGQLLPVSQNTALFSLIGTTYGGDGRSTMGLPDLQGRAPMHPGRGPGLTSRRLGEKVGVTTVTLTEAQIPSHSHTVRATNGSGGVPGPSSSTSFSSSGLDSLYHTDTQTNQVDMAMETLSATGGSQSHDNVQPYLTLNFIIALQGLYPSRG